MGDPRRHRDENEEFSSGDPHESRDNTCCDWFNQLPAALWSYYAIEAVGLKRTLAVFNTDFLVNSIHHPAVPSVTKKNIKRAFQAMVTR